MNAICDLFPDWVVCLRGPVRLGTVVRLCDFAGMRVGANAEAHRAMTFGSRLIRTVKSYLVWAFGVLYAATLLAVFVALAVKLVRRVL